MSMYELDHAELSTVLAALRFYEDKGLGEPDNRPEWIHEIATDGGAVMASLDGKAIGELCDRLNVEGTTGLIAALEQGAKNFTFLASDLRIGRTPTRDLISAAEAYAKHLQAAVDHVRGGGS